MRKTNPPNRQEFAATGIPALDAVLGGGFPAAHLYLVQGNPGAGKTTLGLQFLLEGVRQGQSVLYVTLSETKEELRQVAESHGWTLDGITVHELTPDESTLRSSSISTMYQPSEVELSEFTELILNKVEELKPKRVVLDSMSELRLLAQSALRYRRQILALKQFFIGHGATILMLDDKSSERNDLHLETLAHGVLDLEQLPQEYGSERRRMRVSKLRGSAFEGGYHDFVIRRGGIEVFPRIAAFDSGEQVPLAADLKSGLAELDELLGGGIARGGSALLMGPAGAGKSSLALLYAVAAAEQGERAAVFIFDESKSSLFRRTAKLLPAFAKHVDSGRITLTRVEPAEISPGEFAGRLRLAAEGKDGHDPASLIVIDSLNGYMTSMPEERFLLLQLHELLSYLARKGVITMMIVAHHGIIANFEQAPIDTSYLADLVIMLRYFESRGEIRKAISVVKKRTGPHERTIRELLLRGSEIRVGEPLVHFDGVLTGTPQYRGAYDSLVKEER